MPQTLNQTPEVIHAVVFPDGGLWVAQCIEVDLAISARDRQALPKLVRNQLRAQIELDRRRGRPPFSTLKPAPRIFQALYRESDPWQEVRLSNPFVDALKWLAHRGVQSGVALAMSQHSPAELQRA